MNVTFAANSSYLQEKSTGNCFKELPPRFLSFEEFKKEFNLGATSTEQLHPTTTTLSQTIYKSTSEGLGLLLDVDEKVVEGLENFNNSIETLAPELAKKIGEGGRIFLIRSGSSSRVGIDIAAKCTLAFPETKEQIQGVSAGGNSALIRAKEGFEDSEADGAKALENYNLSPSDTVILISASGSASFNVGCGHFFAEKGTHVLYFFNSKSIPSRTQNLFDRTKNPVIPLCINIGPQAIAGSTRLQRATLAEAGLRALLVSALYLNKGEKNLALAYPRELALRMREGLLLIRQHLTSIEKFITVEKTVFSNPRSNFRQLGDVTNQGYVTFIVSEASMREVLIDSTNLSQIDKN
jgi:N-acetylmuramic acid 6-phosphate etherase